MSLLVSGILATTALVASGIVQLAAFKRGEARDTGSLILWFRRLRDGCCFSVRGTR